MRRDPVSVIWLGGLGLAVLLYLLDPGEVVAALDAFAREAAQDVSLALSHLTLAAFDAVRAAALAAFAVFWALCLVSIRRGGRGRTALVAVSAVFFLLLAADRGMGGDRRWSEALLLAGVAALVMTRRVRGGSIGNAVRSARLR